MNLKNLLLIVLISTFGLNLNAQEQKTVKPTLMYIINGEEVTEDYVNKLDVNRIKSLNKGVSDEQKATLVKKYGDKVNNSFIMVVSLYSDEEMKSKKPITKEEAEMNQKNQLAENEKRERETTLISAGEQSADFTVTMADGAKIKLSDLKGKVVLLNFWATWCGPCMMEFNEIPATIIDRFKDQKFVFLPISRGETREVVQKKMGQLKAKGIIFNVGIDSKKDIYNLYAKEFIPRNFIIDQKGKVVYTSIGYDEDGLHKIAEKIAELLKEN
jgi:thiol-disulfide isomerase/thioredoxin